MTHCKPDRHRLTTRALKRPLSARQSHHRRTVTTVPVPLTPHAFRSLCILSSSRSAFFFIRVVACPYDAPDWRLPPLSISCHLICCLKICKVHGCRYLLLRREYNTLVLSVFCTLSEDSQPTAFHIPPGQSRPVTFCFGLPELCYNYL